MFGLENKHKRSFASLFTLCLVLAWVGGFSGGITHPSASLSPYLSAVAKVEHETFRDLRDQRQRENQYLKSRSRLMDRERRLNERAYDRKVREKILQILTRYKTGLKEKRDREIPDWILAQSKRYSYDPLFLTALIITESSFNNWALSHRGAMGLMQILPGTGRAMAGETRVKWKGKSTLYDPRINIALGSYYLNKLRQRFGDLKLALEAYNHGPSRLEGYLKRGMRPSKYSKKVLKIYEMIHFEPA